MVKVKVDAHMQILSYWASSSAACMARSWVTTHSAGLLVHDVSIVA